MLSDSLADLGLTQVQCHALIELEHYGVITAGELAELLRVDKSTMSRALAQLKRSGFVATREDAEDRRRKPLTLTARGKKKVQRIHDFANRQVEEALALLRPHEQETVVSGMALYAKALRRAGVQRELEIRPIEPQDSPHVAGVIRRVMPEFGAEGPGFALNDPEVDDMHGAYDVEGAGYFVLTRNGTIIGGAGYAPLEGGPPGVCELRKMYFLPEARGKGMGKLLLNTVLDAAAEAGYQRCYLETLEHMTQARALYRASGFEDLDAPMGNTGHFGCNSWLIRTLPR